MLQALADFNAYVDKRAGTAADKAAIKAYGATLARAGEREAVAHAVKHLDAAVADNPDDAELLARVAQMKKYLESAKVNDG